MEHIISDFLKRYNVLLTRVNLVQLTNYSLLRCAEKLGQILEHRGPLFFTIFFLFEINFFKLVVVTCLRKYRS
jgi:hypothetical protein